MSDQNIDTICPRSKKEWRAWLQKNHVLKQSVWLIYHRKNSGVPTITWSEAVDEALCFGWIDSKKQTIDDEKYRQFFSKRKADSTWSKINKDKVAQLIDDGLMTQAGLDSIAIAKKNGSWTFLDTIEALEVPTDLNKELKKHGGAKKYFNSLSNSKKKILLYWVLSAKRPETRQKRITEIAEFAGQGLMPKQFR